GGVGAVGAAAEDLGASCLRHPGSRGGSAPRARGRRAREPFDDARGLLLLAAPEVVGRVELDEGQGTPTFGGVLEGGEGGVVHGLQTVEDGPTHALRKLGAGERLLSSARLRRDPVGLASEAADDRGGPLPPPAPA